MSRLRKSARSPGSLPNGEDRAMRTGGSPAMGILQRVGLGRGPVTGIKPLSPPGETSRFPSPRGRSPHRISLLPSCVSSSRNAQLHGLGESDARDQPKISPGRSDAFREGSTSSSPVSRRAEAHTKLNDGSHVGGTCHELSTEQSVPPD